MRPGIERLARGAAVGLTTVILEPEMAAAINRGDPVPIPTIKFAMIATGLAIGLVFPARREVLISIEEKILGYLNSKK